MEEIKRVYPIVISETDDGYYVDIPDFGVATQGKNIADAMAMARDAIGILGIDMEDDEKKYLTQTPSKLKQKKQI